MSNKKIVIIGCGAGGGTAAQFARKTDRKKKVIIFEKGCYPQYSKCGLPYTISGIIKKPKDLVEFSEEWFLKAKIELHLNTTVLNVDPNKKKITVNHKDKGTYDETYNSLIISTGSQPILPPIKNIKTPKGLTRGVVTIRTIDDINMIISLLPKVKKVTVVGGGLIGLEMADNLVKKQKKVTLIEALPHVLPMLDDDLSTIIETRIKENIILFTNHFAKEVITEHNQVKKLIVEDKTKKTQTIDTDLLIVATGTKAETTLAKQMGCNIGQTGGIIIDNKSQTSIPDVYAVGDCTEYNDYITGKPVPIGLGSITVRQGIAAGINAAGGCYILPKGVLQTFTSDFFNQQIAGVGPSSTNLESLDIIQGKYKGLSLPEYFPGGKYIIMKTTIDKKTGKILSAQAVGENAAQRINSYAVAILGNMTIDTFRKVETAYAPPVAPTLDVVSLTADIAYTKKQRIKNK